MLERVNAQLTAMQTGCVAETSNAVNIREDLKKSVKRLKDIRSSVELNILTVRDLEEQLKVKLLSVEEDAQFYEEKVRERQEAVGVLKDLEDKMSRIAYDKDEEIRIDKQFDAVTAEYDALSMKLQSVESQLNNSLARYQIPSDVDMRKVAGHLSSLFSVTAEKLGCATALQVIGGGQLGYIVVEDKSTAKSLLAHNRFSHGYRKVTMLPIRDCRVAEPIRRDQLVSARRAVGSEADDDSRVLASLECIIFDSRYIRPLQFVYGNTLICNTADVARKIAYDPSIRLSTCTFKGDMFKPSGAMHGGSTKNIPKTIMLHRERQQLTEQLTQLKATRSLLEAKRREQQDARAMYNSLHMQLRCCKKSLENKQEGLDASKAGSGRQQASTLQQELEEKKKEIEQLRAEENSAAESAEQLSRLQQTDNQPDRESVLKRETKEFKSKVKQAEIVAEKLRKEGEKAMVQLKSLDQQISQEVETNQAMAQQLDSAKQLKAQADEITRQKREELQNAKQRLSAAEDEVSAVCGDLQQLMEVVNEHLRELRELTINFKKATNSIAQKEKEHAQETERLKRLTRQFRWLDEDPSSADQINLSPDAVRRRLAELRAKQEEMKNKINGAAAAQYDRVKKKMDELMNMFNKVTCDRHNILKLIEELDKAKKESLSNTLANVNRYLLSIFTTLLPGAQATLKPAGPDFLTDGLELKVAFNSVWRQGLTELSGGQRSLLALSLVLSLLKCKPAPVYILDEIDAALDLSHTANIGEMIQTEFPNSQFIIVSLKDGMFSNADVLFRTKFVDNTSVVERVVGGRQRRGR
eukprot:GHVS01022736.1.p1 GENE.GHVS01022736.1~~GHVS01022736.1.p1  ORF type:complete len:810 (+),score=142.43 GHVS01022736.1:509-2938(+)